MDEGKPRGEDGVFLHGGEIGIVPAGDRPDGVGALDAGWTRVVEGGEGVLSAGQEQLASFMAQQ